MRTLILTAATCLLATPLLAAQVHYHPDGNPWKQRANSGPDAEVPGWYYNLGITGIRVELMEDRPEALRVRYIFPDSPADGKVEIGDWIIGAAGRAWDTPHRNGYGMDTFGPHGPMAAFAEALESSQEEKSKGRLELRIDREGKVSTAKLKVAPRYGTFSNEFPAECKKSDRILSELLDYLVEHQNADGAWGSPPRDTFAPLALMSSEKRTHRQAVLKNVRMHARTTKAVDQSWLINWRYMAAGIVMSEYYLLTNEKWLLPELQEVYDFLSTSQYMDMSQINPKSKESHPHSYPKHEMDSHGGWGHNIGFEGYGPIAMLTAQGALTFALMKECGIEVDRAAHDAAYAFLDRAAGKNHYVWYEDQSAGDKNWADMGRTGTTAIAYHMSPWSAKQRRRGKDFAQVIGLHPQSFPDTHGSPPMGMAYTALGASVDARAFRSLLDANKWWFTLAQCQDGSFYYQPNRDNAGYGADSRIKASAAVALILSIPKAALVMTGRQLD
jgi:hypothetical protein